MEVEVVGEDSDIKTSIFFMDFRFLILKKLIIKMDIVNPSVIRDQKFQFKVKSDFKTFFIAEAFKLELHHPILELRAFSFSL